MVRWYLFKKNVWERRWGRRAPSTDLESIQLISFAFIIFFTSCNLLKHFGQTTDFYVDLFTRKMKCLRIKVSSTSILWWWTWIKRCWPNSRWHRSAAWTTLKFPHVFFPHTSFFEIQCIIFSTKKYINIHKYKNITSPWLMLYWWKQKSFVCFWKSCLKKRYYAEIVVT